MPNYEIEGLSLSRPADPIKLRQNRLNICDISYILCEMSLKCN